MSSSMKRKIAQSDLRLLMLEKKRKMSETKKKIDSPLAKYLDNGTLQCIICNSVIRNESIWTVHINSKQHRENINKKRVQKDVQPIPVTSLTNKLIKKESNVVSFAPEPVKVKGILKNKQPEQTQSVSFPSTVAHSSKSEPITESDTSNQMDVDTDTESASNTIPEGFFDDPILDAKARNVDYKDPIEEEWERYKREIQEESAVSNQIVEEEQDQATVDREIEHIDQEIHSWSRLRMLEVKREQMQEDKARKSITVSPMNQDDDQDSSYGSEEEFDEYIDWRSKRS